MPATPSPYGPAPTSRSEANDAIRALVDARADGEPWPAEEYEALLVAWHAAAQPEIWPAA
ncbi:hypothetical protein [Streptomyces sp. NPDC050504]|uniref:hypothetical protein n=1 Tax=Streptomyces sp. NPDC050504 TaxID=3365618 RepID=UPI0037A3FB40